jgi:hypothetical protein
MLDLYRKALQLRVRVIVAGRLITLLIRTVASERQINAFPTDCKEDRL